MKTLTEYLNFHTETHRAYVHITPQVVIEAQFCRCRLSGPLAARGWTLQNCGPHTFVEHPQSDADRSFLTSASEGSALAPSTYLKSTMVPWPFFRAILPTNAPSVD